MTLVTVIGNELVEVGGVTGQVMSLDKSGSEADIDKARPGQSVSKRIIRLPMVHKCPCGRLQKSSRGSTSPEVFTMALGLCCSVIAGCAVPV